MFGVPFLTPSLMWGWAVLSWRGLPSHPGCCQMPPLHWVRRQATTGPRATYVHVCDYSCQWSPSPVVMLLSPQVLGEEGRRLTGYRDKTCVRNFLKWGSHCTGTIPLCLPYHSRSSGMMSHHDWRLHQLQWMARSCSVLWHALCTPQCIAELPFWPMNLTADFLCPICQNSLHMAGWAKPISPRV